MTLMEQPTQRALNPLWTNQDKVNLIENTLKIDNKQGIVVPFILNRMQRDFMLNKVNRNIILKHRQGGLTSVYLADMYLDCGTIDYMTCAVISHETRATQRLLARVQSYHDNMDEPKPVLDANSRSEKRFLDTHSSIYVGTAGAKAFGRGDTIRKVHLSELAFYENPEPILNGVEDSVPLQGEITIECFDDQTEVLTNRGWLLFKDVLLTDKVLSKDLITNIAYWSEITNKIEREAPELIYVTGKGINFAVTPNHNIWARKSRTVQPYKFYQAKELFDYSEWEFDSSMDWVGTEQEFFHIGDISIPMDLWLEYLGYFLSEGSVSASYVTIFQDGEYTEFFKEASRKLAAYFGKTSREHGNKDFRINDMRFVRYLSQYTKPKRFPVNLLNLSKRQLKIFFEAYMKGDGEKKRNRCVTIDIPLRDSLQEIGLKLGFRSNYVIRPSRIDSNMVNHQECYVISFYKSNKPSVRQSRCQINRESYTGMVYCLTIPRDHLLMTRRNGKTVWLANCTPNGEGNIFYDRWIKARSGRSPYKPFFYPWWFTEEYSIPRDSPIALPADRGELTEYSQDELTLIARNGLKEDQIRWRRWKIGEKGGLFWQEYPEDEVSCFITIGSPVFDVDILNGLAGGAYQGESQDGGWFMWVPPQAGTRYIISSDSAAGSPTGSFSTFTVIDDLYQVCATFQARVEPAELSALLKKVGGLYNNAMVVIERNFTGYAVLEGLKDYPNVYRQRDFLTGKVTNNLGWWTNTQTKEYMMSKMKEVLHLLRCWDVNLIRQLRSYRYIKNKPVAQSFDDVAMALMIGIAVKQFEGGSRGYMGSTNTWGW